VCFVFIDVTELNKTKMLQRDIKENLQIRQEYPLTIYTGWRYVSLDDDTLSSENSAGEEGVADDGESWSRRWRMRKKG
jgi:hypothetical protein